MRFSNRKIIIHSRKREIQPLLKLHPLASEGRQQSPKMIPCISVVLCLSVVLNWASVTHATMQKNKNFLLIAVDDLRPMFGRSFGEEEVLTPKLDNFFLDRNGTAFQNSYVQIAVCGPSRASILTGRRPGMCTVASANTNMQQFADTLLLLAQTPHRWAL